jgi:hypothetical protein
MCCGFISIESLFKFILMFSLVDEWHSLNAKVTLPQVYQLWLVVRKKKIIDRFLTGTT